MRIAFVLALATIAGCSPEDGTKLARVGRLAAEKLREAAPARTPLGDWKVEESAESRVRTRLRTDATLASQPIQVVEEADGLHLRGRVPTQEQADWAMRLARETVGVTQVVNELAVGP